MRMRRAAAVIMAAVLGAGAMGQMFPGEAPPPATQEGGRRPVVINKPTVDKEKGEVSLPAAFWHEKLTNWVEVAACGRPSDFLHETIVSYTTPKKMMIGAMRDAGFRDADAWTKNVADFPRIRGDRVLIVLGFEHKGEKKEYMLDELLTFEGWGTSIGPFGWMYKGDPGAGEAAQGMAAPAAAPAPASGPAATGPATQGADAEETMLTGDVQIALQFKGLQHLRRSFIDHPLCYDEWIFPAFRYHRNHEALGKDSVAIFESNGEIPVTMRMRKVTEAEFLKHVTEHWHDKDFRAYAAKQMPVAEGIDKAKQELWETLPKLKAKAELLATTDGGLEKLSGSDEFRKVAVLAAEIEAGYAALDLAWTTWSAEHVKWQTEEEEMIRELEAQKKKWVEHMTLKRERAEAMVQVEKALSELVGLRRGVQNAETQAKIRKLAGDEIAGRSKATLAENKQVLAYWTYEKQRLTADDPRESWVRHIAVQHELAQAKDEVGKVGLTLGVALQEGKDETALAAAQNAYQRAAFRAMIAEMEVELADVEFEISKREGLAENGLPTDEDLPLLKKKRDALKGQIKEARATAGGSGGN